MSPNHHRYANVLPVARFILGAAIVLSITSAAIYYVWCRNQIDASGREITKYEGQLAVLQKQNEVVRAKIARLSSISMLDQRHKSGFIKLERIVQFEPTVRIVTSEGDEVRTISNPNRSSRR